MLVAGTHTTGDATNARLVPSLWTRPEKLVDIARGHAAGWQQAGSRTEVD